GKWNQDDFLAALRAGEMIGTNGVVIDAKLDAHLVGIQVFAPSPRATLQLEVRAAPWIPVSEIRIIVNGKVVQTIDSGFVTPADPFGTKDLVRWSGTIALNTLVPTGPDVWLLVEAGMPLPPAADLDDDGIVDTGDNNGDGVADLADVSAGDSSGPIHEPTDP